MPENDAVTLEMPAERLTVIDRTTAWWDRKRRQLTWWCIEMEVAAIKRKHRKARQN